jgi:hypothetical protein
MFLTRSFYPVKDRYQSNYFICIKDFNAETNTSLKLNFFSFFICGRQHHPFSSSIGVHDSSGTFSHN